MSVFQYRGGELWAEQVPLARIAGQFGTPCYVYSRAALAATFDAFDAALASRDHLVCYAVKANSNLAILDLFARRGGGFDIVSGGELARVLAAGGDPGRVVFSGVGKSAQEIRAGLEAGILCFNVESESELERISAVASDLGRTARVSLRVNPDVDAGTHPYISTGLKQNKFGVPHGQALAAYRRAASLPGIRVTGIDCHIGSQILDLAPFAAAIERVVALVAELARDGIEIRHVDVGGGLGIRYRQETPPDIADYGRVIARGLAGYAGQVLVEPGRALVGNAGLLLTRVEYLKQGEDRRFAIVDAAMNDLMRPALYEAWHDIVTVREQPDAPRHAYDVVGPVCESGDFLGHDRSLALAPGELLAVMSAGAYGMSMSSNYNTRPRAAEVMVDGDRVHLVRERERVEQLFALEHRLPG